MLDRSLIAPRHDLVTRPIRRHCILSSSPGLTSPIEGIESSRSVDASAIGPLSSR
jgi:hypothetical protein